MITPWGFHSLCLSLILRCDDMQEEEEAGGGGYLSMTVRSLPYRGLSGCREEGRGFREWLRPGWGWSCEADSEAKTLAAAAAAVLGGRKPRSRPGSPDAVSTGWARTLASRLSGWAGEEQH